VHSNLKKGGRQTEMKVENLSGKRGKGHSVLTRVLARLGVNTSSPTALAATLPFAKGDLTAGCENELQTAVLGRAEDVDLSLYIQESNYYLNIIKRQQRGELPRKALDDLQKCDNTSPETYSFHTTAGEARGGGGAALARETSRRFLLTQLLASYARKSLGLSEDGQNLLVYFSPHPPVRQKRLSRLVSDAFYRELFMNPCLAGWDKGEDKQQLHASVPPGAEPGPVQQPGPLKEAGHHQQQPGGAALRLQHQPGQQRHPHQSGQPALLSQSGQEAPAGCPNPAKSTG
jgi:hypothetical protein